MHASPFLAFTSLGRIFKPCALEALCAICLFLWSHRFSACAIFVALLSAIDYFILSKSRCGCFGNENGDKEMRIHRSDGQCIYYGIKPVPYIWIGSFFEQELQCLRSSSCYMCLLFFLNNFCL